MKNVFEQIRQKATLAGFEQYADTVNENGVNGIILVAPINTEYFGECIDVFEDGTFEHYSQFKNDKLKFDIN